jgi:pyruvate/2-oxoglutarate dehydrogenase complex dihydrolipoamide acyltransferase (E2) component
MPSDVTMPQLGESVAEGTIGRWIKQEGDVIEKDESLAEIITDKITAELPSPFAGRLVKILVPADSQVPVGTAIAQIEEGAAATVVPQEPPAALPVEEAVEAAVPTPQAAPVEEGRMAPDAMEMAGVGLRPQPGAAPAAARETGERQRLSPLVRRLAREHQLDLAQITGTGLEGRVRKDDVLNYLAQRERLAVAQPQPAMAAPPPEVPPAPPRPLAPAVSMAEGDRVLAVTGLRQAVVASLVRGKDEAPQATSIVEVDMTNIVAWQEQQRAAIEARERVSIDHVPFVLRAALAGLRQFPLLNAAWAGDQIISKRDIHLGLSVATDDGWVTPVIRHAAELNVLGLARAIADLTQRALAGRLTAQDIAGGTFTMNNPGAFGTLLSTSAIQHPQAAVLTMDAIMERPVAIDKMIGIRAMMYLCLSYDQRIIDGATAGRFLKFVKDRLEGPAPGIHE